MDEPLTNALSRRRFLTRSAIAAAGAPILGGMKASLALRVMTVAIVLFTTDRNIQSAHWAVHAGNRLEQGQALLDRLHDRREELVKAVRPVEWQEDSACLPIDVALDRIGNREHNVRRVSPGGDEIELGKGEEAFLYVIPS